MDDVKQKDSSDKTWINELPLDEFPFEDGDLDVELTLDN